MGRFVAGLLLGACASPAGQPAVSQTFSMPGGRGAGGPRDRLCVGEKTSCALLPDGTVRCFGENEHGQLGDGTTESRVVPVEVEGVRDVREIACGSAHACAATSDGRLLCWGDNRVGQVGPSLGRFVVRATPVAGVQDVVRVAAWGERTCVVLEDGTARCWGSNYGGALGDGTNHDRVAPTAVLGLTNVVDLDLSARSCAVLQNGTVRCWGDDVCGSTRDDWTPTALEGVREVARVAAGAHVATLGSDGTLRARECVPPSRGRPAAVEEIARLAGVREAAASTRVVCAIRADARVSCIGRDSEHLFETEISASDFVDVPALRGATEIDLTTFHGCAWFSDGSLRCWGRDASGELGRGAIPVTDRRRNARGPVAIALDAAPDQAPAQGRGRFAMEGIDLRATPPSGCGLRAAEPPVVVGGSCGNGVLDVLEYREITGEGGARGRLPILEPCDGRDFGGLTCERLEYPGGRLLCGPSCMLETACCSPCPDDRRIDRCIRGQPRWSGQVGAIGVAVRGDEVGVLTFEHHACQALRFHRYGPSLSRVSSSEPFAWRRPGADHVTHVELVATSVGWVGVMAATGGGGHVDVFGIGADGDPRRAFRVWDATPLFVAHVPGRDRVALLLAPTDRSEAVLLVVVRPDGSLERSVRMTDLPGATSRPGPADVAPVDDGLLVARMVEGPNRARRLVVDRIELDGRVAASREITDPRAAEAQIAPTADGAAIAYGTGEVVLRRLDRSGDPAGDAVTVSLPQRGPVELALAGREALLLLGPTQSGLAVARADLGGRLLSEPLRVVRPRNLPAAGPSSLRQAAMVRVGRKVVLAWIDVDETGPEGRVWPYLRLARISP